MPSYKKDGSGVMPRLALYNNMISSTTKNWKWHVHFFATSMKRSPRIRMSGSCHFKYPARDAQPDNKCLSKGTHCIYCASERTILKRTSPTASMRKLDIFKCFEGENDMRLVLDTEFSTSSINPLVKDVHFCKQGPCFCAIMSALSIKCVLFQPLQWMISC